MLAYCHGQGWVRTRTRSPFIGMSLCPWRYLLDTAISLKKGNFNTPSVFLLLKKENSGFDCYFKTAVRSLIFCWRMKTLPPNNGFFYLPLVRWVVFTYNDSFFCFFADTLSKQSWLSILRLEQLSILH